MSAAVPAISAVGLLLAFTPAAIVIGIMYRWTAKGPSAVYATARMLAQLLVIGYVLIYLFESNDARVIGAVLLVMLATAAWIAIRPLDARTPRLYRDSIVAIGGGSLPTLALVTHGVIGIEPWFSARYVIPLGGMIFASAMNTVSLAAERLNAERARGLDFPGARRAAFLASMIPMINTFLAVGIVTLPGMMTGQVLSGVSPLIAAKYQIVVMAMLFGASGIAAALYLALQRRSP